MTMKLAFAQTRALSADQDGLDAASRAVAEAASLGADVVVLPELFRWAYPAQEMTPSGFDRAEAIPGPTSDACAALASEHGVVLVASVFEERAPGLGFNTALVFERDGSLAGTYRKTHIPDDPLYYEKFYFTPGDGPLAPIDTSAGRLGVLICWDQWFPEAARAMALSGADVLVYPTAIGRIDAEGSAEHARQLDAWQTVQRGHAIANGLPLVAVNRVGREGDLDFWGHSFAVGPQGEWLAQLGEETSVALVDLDPARTREVRTIWPFFRDRRPELYGALQKRWNA